MRTWRHFLATCAVCAIGSSLPEATAQGEANQRSHIIAIAPGILQLYPNIRYWGFVGQAFALGGGVHVPWGTLTSGRVTGYNVTLEPRYYVSRSSWVEWYFAAGFSFGHVRHADTTSAPAKLMASYGGDIYTDDSKHFHIGFDLSLGYVWNVTEISAYRGMNFDSNVYTTNGYVLGTEHDGWMPAMRVDVGWAF